MNTVTSRLRIDRNRPALADRVGGSTYTLEVWPGHPHEAQAFETLRSLRSQLGALRDQVERYNEAHPPPERHTQVLMYVGQCSIERGEDEADES